MHAYRPPHEEEACLLLWQLRLVREDPRREGGRTREALQSRARSDQAYEGLRGQIRSG